MIFSEKDPYQLRRFVVAQRVHYKTALREIRSGRKTGHWIWYMYPQLACLGRSQTAIHYGIRDLGEARAYWQHPVLGVHLRESAQALLQVEGRTATQILGQIDQMKVRSCMTLFCYAAPEEPLFRQVLEKYYAGEEDPLTAAALGH